MTTVYLDHAATTPVDPAVRDAMLPYLEDSFGNPSSAHRTGQAVRRAIDHARDTLAATLGCEAGEVYFTSGGTEANNTALIGVLWALRDSGRDHLIVANAEHHAVLDTAVFLRDEMGFRVSVVPVDGEGRVTVDAVAEVMDDRTALVSVMHANNEVGAINPVRAIADLAHGRGALLHTDAVQTLGALPLSVDPLGADLLTVTAHKIYGPKGSGALYIRRGTRIAPLLHGGSQERQKRPGTENVVGVVGFGAAAALLPTWRDAEAERQAELRDGFLESLRARIPGVRLNGPTRDRLPNNANVAFDGADGETLLLALDMKGIAASAGSACASGSIEPSHVLKAIGLPHRLGQASVRFSLGRGTTEADLDYVLEALAGLTAGAPG